MFDDESSLGLVRMYFEELCRDLAAAALGRRRFRAPVLAGDFEAELNRNLAALFGRATDGRGDDRACRLSLLLFVE